MVPKHPEPWGQIVDPRMCVPMWHLLLALEIRLKLKLGWFSKSSFFSIISTTFLSQMSRHFAIKSWPLGNWDTAAEATFEKQEPEKSCTLLLMQSWDSTQHHTEDLGVLDGFFLFVLFKLGSIKKMKIRTLHSCILICGFEFLVFIPGYNSSQVCNAFQL